MKKRVILFVVEGPSDQDALIPFIENEVQSNKVRTTVKNMHGDILTKYIDGTRRYEVNTSNVRRELSKKIDEYLDSPSIKSEQIKRKDLKKIYYITDTDYCFFQEFEHSKNKKECLMKIFYFEKLELKNNIEVDIDVIFFSKHLEHVLRNIEENLSNKEKAKIAIEFSKESLKNRSFYIDTFKNQKKLKTWKSFSDSYIGIQNCRDRACNMNNLLDEIESWKTIK